MPCQSMVAIISNYIIINIFLYNYYYIIIIVKLVGFSQSSAFSKEKNFSYITLAKNFLISDNLLLWADWKKKAYTVASYCWGKWGVGSSATFIFLQTPKIQTLGIRIYRPWHRTWLPNHSISVSSYIHLWLNKIVCFVVVVFFFFLSEIKA